jgi:phytanoyl-CoA hydroxylase
LSGPNLSDKPRHAYTVHAIEGTAEYPRDNWLLRSPAMPMHGFADPDSR